MTIITVTDPDVQISGGRGYPDPEIRGGGVRSLKFGLEIKGSPRPPRPPGSFPGSATVIIVM